MQYGISCVCAVMVAAAASIGVNFQQDAGLGSKVDLRAASAARLIELLEQGRIESGSSWAGLREWNEAEWLDTRGRGDEPLFPRNLQATVVLLLPVLDLEGNDALSESVFSLRVFSGEDVRGPTVELYLHGDAVYAARRLSYTPPFTSRWYFLDVERFSEYFAQAKRTEVPNNWVDGEERRWW